MWRKLLFFVLRYFSLDFHKVIDIEIYDLFLLLFSFNSIIVIIQYSLTTYMPFSYAKWVIKWMIL